MMNGGGSCVDQGSKMQQQLYFCLSLSFYLYCILCKPFRVFLICVICLRNSVIGSDSAAIFHSITFLCLRVCVYVCVLVGFFVCLCDLYR